MISWLRSSCDRRLPAPRRASSGAGKAASTRSSKKWANGPWPTSWSRPATRSVSTTRPSEGSGSPGASEGSARAARAAAPAPTARLVHHAEAVREPRVLGGREDPARALELADPAQPLEPRGVEQVVLGGVLVRQARCRRLVAREPLGQLEVAVDRVADEVDGGEGVARHALRIRARPVHARSPVAATGRGLRSAGEDRGREGRVVRVAVRDPEPMCQVPAHQDVPVRRSCPSRLSKMLRAASWPQSYVVTR